ncbi:MAG: cbb3-type cytochrome c oxidase subunit I [Kouleothrix sp.]
MFWFSHPAVYVFILPGLGSSACCRDVRAQAALTGYKWIAISSMGIALVGFLVWAHHMFTSGIDTCACRSYAALVAVPTGNEFFQLGYGTLWRGKIIYPPSVHTRRDHCVLVQRADRAA